MTLQIRFCHARLSFLSKRGPMILSLRWYWKTNKIVLTAYADSVMSEGDTFNVISCDTSISLLSRVIHRGDYPTISLSLSLSHRIQHLPLPLGNKLRPRQIQIGRSVTQIIITLHIYRFKKSEINKENVCNE